jgi:hypothetical protein
MKSVCQKKSALPLLLQHYSHSQDTETTKVSIKRRISNEIVTNTYILEYYTVIKMKEILPIGMTLIKVEDIMLCKISQTQKENY